ncbi:hypothetical protein RJ527_12850 [Thalassospiraceae bacterium LMO-SO8]|jgi:hypothetical protein|nr:hypothetical protein [Alphaproteobacteria bacterium LMO-S08]WND74927.1 hypothetical protein RJ527_12850 [Thalassospiraceae bacterium LMO-SO8]
MTGKRNTTARMVRTLGGIAIAAIALTACRAEEQGRMIRYEPGVYKGKPDAQLSESRLEELRNRTRSQGGASGTGFAGGAKVQDSGADVRVPGELNERAQNQGGAK